MAFFKGHGRSLAHGWLGGFTWWATTIGASSVSSYYTAHSAYVSGLPAYKAIPLGCATFVILAFAFYLLSLARAAWLRKTTPTVAPYECPDKWLHDIADEQNREIRSWIHLEKWTLEDSDLNRARPYLQFRFTIHNGSIYHVFFTMLSGKIDYANDPIMGTAKWVGDPINLEPGGRNDILLRFIIDEPEDVTKIKNINSQFVLHGLKVRVETKPETAPKDYSFMCSMDVDPIRIKYPKMEMEIQAAKLIPHYDFNAPFEKWRETLKGSFINIKLRFANPRTSAIVVDSFKLDTGPNKRRITLATTGNIYGKTTHIHGDVLQQETLTPNLNDQFPIIAEHRAPFEGWLQFYLPGIAPTDLEGATPTVIIMDKANEEHRRGTPQLQSDNETVNRFFQNRNRHA